MATLLRSPHRRWNSTRHRGGDTKRRASFALAGNELIELRVQSARWNEAGAAQEEGGNDGCYTTIRIPYLGHCSRPG